MSMLHLVYSVHGQTSLLIDRNTKFIEHCLEEYRKLEASGRSERNVVLVYISNDANGAIIGEKLESTGWEIWTNTDYYVGGGYATWYYGIVLVDREWLEKEIRSQNLLNESEAIEALSSRGPCVVAIVNRQVEIILECIQALHIRLPGAVTYR